MVVWLQYFNNKVIISENTCTSRCGLMKKGPHQQHHLMEKLSIKGFEILVICFDQLWYEEKAFFQKM